MKNILLGTIIALVMLPSMTFAQTAPAPYTKAWYDEQAKERAVWISQNLPQVQAQDQINRVRYAKEAKDRAVWISQHLTEVQAQDKVSRAYYSQQAQVRANARNNPNFITPQPTTNSTGT